MPNCSLFLVFFQGLYIGHNIEDGAIGFAPPTQTTGNNSSLTEGSGEPISTGITNVFPNLAFTIGFSNTAVLAVTVLMALVLL